MDAGVTGVTGSTLQQVNNHRNYWRDGKRDWGFGCVMMVKMSRPGERPPASPPDVDGLP
jgi:hypothetical protein